MQILSQITDADEAQVSALARMLAATARPGQTILLDGSVGAGKTHFARTFIQARQGDLAEDVPSPTFTLVQTYADPCGTEIWHADLYRLTDPAELDELGLDEAMDHSICLIEWPDRMDVSPPLALWISIRPGSAEDTRHVTLSGKPDAWPDIARAVERALNTAAWGWSDARVLALAGDASTRRFFRLVRPDETAVMMDDPPPGSIFAYLTMTSWLIEHGFSAPRLLRDDRDAGLLLLEDLGDDLVARVLEMRPAKTRSVYQEIVDLLVDLHRHDPPSFVTQLDGAALADLVSLFGEWYPQAAGYCAGEVDDIAPLIAGLYIQLAGDVAPILSLRDFHAENLIWRHAKPLGLLDFQDAVAAHPAYDLVSALQDARRDVDPDIEDEMIARYLELTGMEPDAFRATYALLGLQRNLRIMGIFTRLALRDGKPRYLQFMPRVWGYVHRNLAHPALADLANIIDRLPAPTQEITDRIAARCPNPKR